MREEGWGGEEGEGGGKAKVLKVYTFNDWKIDKLRDWPPHNGCSSGDKRSFRWGTSLLLCFEDKRRSTAFLQEKWGEKKS